MDPPSQGLRRDRLRIGTRMDTKKNFKPQVNPPPLNLYSNDRKKDALAP
jgi:hypothetical protein